MIRMMMLLTWALSSVLPAVAAAQVALPRSLESCADVDTIVSNVPKWDIQGTERASDDGWTEAVIRVDRTPGSRGLSVRESDIDLFVACWEKDVRANGRFADYDFRMDRTITDLFPPTERVALALTALAGRLNADSNHDVSYVLSALSLLAVSAGAHEEERERVSRSVTPILLEQWWRCWDARSKEWGVDGATYGCRSYSDVTSRWLLGFVQPSKEPQLQRAEAILKQLLDQQDSKARQVGVLASYSRASLWDATTRLGLIALKDRDRDVRLMAVRLSDEARLNEEGKPHDAELRAALQELARRDPDAAIRKEASAVLQLEPYLGPG